MATKIWAVVSLGTMTASASASAGPFGASLAGTVSALLVLLAAHEPARRWILTIICPPGETHVRRRSRTVRRR